MANQKNVLYALGTLYLLEMKYLSKIVASNEPDVPNKKSELFELDNWPCRFTPMREMFACIDGEVCQMMTRTNIALVSLAAEITTITANIDTLKTNRKEKKVVLKAA